MKRRLMIGGAIAAVVIAGIWIAFAWTGWKSRAEYSGTVETREIEIGSKIGGIGQQRIAFTDILGDRVGCFRLYVVPCEMQRDVRGGHIAVAFDPMPRVDREHGHRLRIAQQGQRVVYRTGSLA